MWELFRIGTNLALAHQTPWKPLNYRKSNFSAIFSSSLQVQYLFYYKAISIKIKVLDKCMYYLYFEIQPLFDTYSMILYYLTKS